MHTILMMCGYDRNGNLTKSIFPSVRSMSYDINNRVRGATSRQTVGEATWDYSVGHLSGADGVLRRSTYYYGRPDDTGSAATVAQRALSNGSALIPGFGGRDSIFTEQPLSMHERTIEYCGDYRYDYIGMLTSPEVTLQFPQGYRDTDGWHFYLRDHLGSVRLVCSPDCAVEEFYHYYPYGEPMAESSYGSFKAQRFTGKESDTWLGVSLIDNDARFKLGMGTVFNSVDHLADHTPGVSPYLFCGGDPINHIDPTGYKWVQEEVDGGYRFYYVRHMSTPQQVKKKWGKDVSIIESGTTLTVDGYKFKFQNDEENDVFGSISINGEVQPKQGLIKGKNFLIGGVTDNDTNLATLSKNWYGTYLGPNNPKTYGEEDAYDYFPKSFLDWAAYNHDKDYDKVHAVGALDAIFNNDPDVIAADIKLALNASIAAVHGKARGESAMGVGTCIAFSFLGTMKIVTSPFVVAMKLLFK